MTTTPILILSGKGKTGRRVVEQLETRGVPYRLASRSSAQRFDWYDDSTWSATIAGAETAYMAPPVGPTGLAQACRFIKQAASEGLRRVGLLSGRGVGSPGRDFAVYDGQLAVEHAVKESGADWTIIQPAWFAQGFSEDFLRYHVLAGEIRVSAGDGGEAWIDTNDVGDVMTAVLLDQAYTGATFASSGPRYLNLTEVVAELSAATARPIEYVDLEPEDHVTELIDQASTARTRKPSATCSRSSATTVPSTSPTESSKSSAAPRATSPTGPAKPPRPGSGSRAGRAGPHQISLWAVGDLPANLSDPVRLHEADEGR